MPARGARFSAPVHSRRGPGYSCGTEGAPTNRKTLNAMVRRIRRYGGPVHADGKGFITNARAVALVRRWFRYPQHVCVQRALHRERGYCLALVRGKPHAVGDRITADLVAIDDRRAVVAYDFPAADPHAGDAR